MRPDLLAPVRNGRISTAQIFSIASTLEGMHRSLNPQYEKKPAVDRKRNSEVLEAASNDRREHYSWLKGAIANFHHKLYAFRIREMLDQRDHLMAELVGNEIEWTQQLRNIRDSIGHVLARQDEWAAERMIAILYSAQMLAELVLLCQLEFTNAAVPQQSGTSLGTGPRT